MRYLATIVLCAVLALPVAANATILFAGGEDTSFTLVGGAAVSTTANAGANFRTAWAREDINFTGTSSDPPTNRITTPTFTAGSTIWAHAQVGCNTNGNTTTSNDQLLRLLDGGTARILVRGTGTAGQFKISTRNNAGTIVDLVTSASGAWTGCTAAPIAVDLAVVYSASGSATLYVGGTQIATFSGDVTTNSATTLNQVEWASHSGNQTQISEVIVATTDTRGMNLLTLTPNGNGNVQSWTGGCTTNINPTAINDTNFINSSTNNQLQECTVQSPGQTSVVIPTGTFGVLALIMETRTLVGATGPQHFDFLTRTGGSDFASSDQAPTTSFSNFNNYIQATNPNTSTSWLTTDLSAALFNIGLKSTP